MALVEAPEREAAVVYNAAMINRGALVLVAAACLACAPEGPSSDERFEALAARYVAESMELGPVGATFAGDHRFDGALDEVSAEARARAADFAETLLAQLESIPRAELSRPNQVDAALLRNRLEGELWRQRELEEWAWNPTWYTGLAGGAVYSLMARDFAPVAERLVHVADRLEQFPRLFEQIRATLDARRVPPIHAETAVAQNRGVLSTLTNLVEPELDALAEGSEERTRLEAAMDLARGAVESHQTWLETELLPNAAGDFRIGAERFDRKLAFTLHTPITRQEIRERAEAKIVEIHDRMYEIALQILADDAANGTGRRKGPPLAESKLDVIREALEVVYRERPKRGEIVPTAREFLEQATTFVRSAGIVTVPDDPVEIIVMPEFRRGVSLAYCDSPGPLDVGQKTFYAVSPLPKDWTPEQERSFLREYNDMGIQVLTMHEAMPGHFLQIAHSNRYPSTLRALLSSGMFIEGWAEYSEEMMVQEGYLGGDPKLHLAVLKLYLRSITNSIIDQGIHVDGMSREEAMEYMVGKAFQEEREAAGKWVRGQLTSAQLSTYFVGYLEHLDLRSEAERRAGAAFDLMAHHDRVLSFGSPPVQFVRALMFDLPIPE